MQVKLPGDLSLSATLHSPPFKLDGTDNQEALATDYSATALCYTQEPAIDCLTAADADKGTSVIRFKGPSSTDYADTSTSKDFITPDSEDKTIIIWPEKAQEYGVYKIYQKFELANHVFEGGSGLNSDGYATLATIIRSCSTEDLDKTGVYYDQANPKQQVFSNIVDSPAQIVPLTDVQWKYKDCGNRISRQAGERWQITMKTNPTIDITVLLLNNAG